MSDSRGRGAGKRLGKWAKLRADRPLVVSSEGQLTTAAEDYRRIAVQIEQNLDFDSGTGKIIAITGPDPRSGKTLLSLNLSQILARRGERRVLLVEADLFRPSMCDYLDVESGTSGLGDVLRHNAPVDDSIVSVWSAGFDVILSGQAGSLSDYITGEGLKRVAAQLRSAYELILVDCPPAGLAAGRTLIGWADKSIVVVRAGRTRRGSIEETLRITGPDRTLGLVLNDARSRQRSTYYSGTYYN